MVPCNWDGLQWDAMPKQDCQAGCLVQRELWEEQGDDAKVSSTEQLQQHGPPSTQHRDSGWMLDRRMDAGLLCLQVRLLLVALVCFVQ